MPMGPPDRVQDVGSIDDFWLADVRRWTSQALDLGESWYAPPDYHRWALQYLRDTGEVFAVRMAGRPYSPVYLLGTVPADDGPEWHATLDRLLHRWAIESGWELAWVVARIRQHTSVLPFRVTREKEAS